MKKVNLCILLCGVVIILVFGCKKESTRNSFNLGEPFFIKANEVKSFIPFNSGESNADSAITLSFEKVITDTRCPIASCYLCYGSSAKIQVLLTQQGKQSSIYLTIPGCREEYECNDQLYYRKDTLGYRICFLKLDPYPTGAPIDPISYKAKLNISKL